jgi:hypothetical protein
MLFGIRGKGLLNGLASNDAPWWNWPGISGDNHLLFCDPDASQWEAWRTGLADRVNDLIEQIKSIVPAEAADAIENLESAQVETASVNSPPSALASNDTSWWDWPERDGDNGPLFGDWGGRREAWLDRLAERISEFVERIKAHVPQEIADAIDALVDKIHELLDSAAPAQNQTLTNSAEWFIETGSAPGVVLDDEEAAALFAGNDAADGGADPSLFDLFTNLTPLADKLDLTGLDVFEFPRPEAFDLPSAAEFADWIGGLLDCDLTPPEGGSGGGLWLEKIVELIRSEIGDLLPEGADLLGLADGAAALISADNALTGNGSTIALISNDLIDALTSDDLADSFAFDSLTEGSTGIDVNAMGSENIPDPAADPVPDAPVTVPVDAVADLIPSNPLLPADFHVV